MCGYLALQEDHIMRKFCTEKDEFDKEKLLVTSLIKSSALLIFIAAPNAILAYRDRPV